MRKVFLLTVAILLVAAVAISGCAKPSAPAPAPAPDKSGGILKIRFDKAAAQFGYPVDIKAADREYSNVSIERLMRATGEKYVYDPLLATGWELAPDKSSYTFHLRKGVKFHDGTPFNAEAAKWNLDNVLESPLPVLKSVKTIDVVDDYTIRLNLSEWTNLLLQELAVDPSCGMVSPTAVEKNCVEWAKTNPVGTGPFKFKEHKRGISVAFDRFDDYWGGAPYLDGTEIIVIPDAMTALASLKAGEIQVLLGVDPTTADQLKAEGQFEVKSTEGLHQIGIFNTKDPNCIWSDKRVRQALEYAVDKETITESLGHGIIHPVYDVIYGAPECPDKVIRKYDPDKARELLAAAGYPNGFKTTLIGPVFANRDFPTAIQAYLAKVGIELKLEFVERATFMGYRFEGGLDDNWLMEPEPGGGNILYSTNNILASTSRNYPSTARTPGFDELINKAIYEADPAKITEMLVQMEMLVYDDAMVVPFWNEGTSGAFSPALQDYEWFLWDGPDYDISKAWLKK